MLVAVAIIGSRRMMVIVCQMSGELCSSIRWASDLIRTAEHVVTVDWSPASLELGDHLVGEDPHGIHHDVARDR